MWNLREWGTFIKKTIKGAVWGVGVGVATLFYGLFAEMWNCFCDKLADRFYLPEVADTNITVFAFVICVAIGMISGIVSATKDCKDRIKKENTDRERRNHAAVCVRLKEMTALANSFSDNLGKHQKDVTFYGEGCCTDVHKRAQDCEELYNTVTQSYNDHTNVKGEA